MRDDREAIERGRAYLEGAPEYASIATLDSDPPAPRRWVIPEWLPRGHVTALFGAGGLGKSLLAQQAAHCVNCGVPFLGLPVEMGPVLGLFCEDDNDELRRRARDILRMQGRSAAGSADGLYLAGRAGQRNELMVATPDREIQTSALFGTLEAECARIRPALVIIDNIAQVYNGPENDRHAVTAFANLLTGLAHRHDCAVLLLGHVAKAEGSEYSGSTAWEAAVRTRLWLERLEDGTLALHKRKANYSARDSIAFVWEAGAFVTVDPDDASAGTEVAKAEAALLAALDRLSDRQIAASHAPSATTYLPRLAAREGLLTGVTPAAAARALAGLLDRGEVEPNCDLPWRGRDRHVARGLVRRHS